MATNKFRDDIAAILVEMLKCPNCAIVCSPPIYMCLNGHNICVSCKCILTECPVCYHQGRPEIRNHFAEEISLNALVPCKNADQGCEDVCKVKDMPAHLDTCNYGYKCLFELCQWRGSVPNLAEHARNVHVDHFFECADTNSTLKSADSDSDSHLELYVSAKMREFNEGDKKKMSTNQFTTSLISFNDNIFWYFSEISDLSKFNVQLRLIGSLLERPSLSTGFLYQLEFRSEDGTRKLTYNNRVRLLEDLPFSDTVFGDKLNLEPFLDDEALMFKLSMSLACEEITPKNQKMVTKKTGSLAVHGPQWDVLKFRDTEWGVKSLISRVKNLHFLKGKDDSDSDDNEFYHFAT